MKNFNLQNFLVVYKLIKNKCNKFNIELVFDTSNANIAVFQNDKKYLLLDNKSIYAINNKSLSAKEFINIKSKLENILNCKNIDVCNLA